MAHCRRVAIAAIVIAAVVASGPAAGAEKVVVRANVTYEKRGHEFRKIRLQITRNSRTWRSGPLGGAFFIRPSVHVRDLDADGELEVWVDTYSGGAHCCLDSRFFRWVPSRAAYTATKHPWRDIGYQRRRLDPDTRPELVSADARFGYMFTAFAASAFPVQIWHFDRGRMIDVTRSYPSRIERDADELWRVYRRFRGPQSDPRGVLAAWLATQYLLDREEEGWVRLESIRKRGELGPRPDLAGWPQGRAYLRELRRFLVKLGYA